MNRSKHLISILLALLLAVTVTVPEAFAAEGGQTQKAAQQEQTQTGQQTQPQVPLPKTKRTLKKNGYKLKFKMDVLVEKPLNANSEPLDLKIKVKKNYRKIKWKPARKPGSVDGYIVLKQKGNKGAYKQIAVLHGEVSGSCAYSPGHARIVRIIKGHGIIGVPGCHHRYPVFI